MDSESVCKNAAGQKRAKGRVRLPKKTARHLLESIMNKRKSESSKFSHARIAADEKALWDLLRPYCSTSITGRPGHRDSVQLRHPCIPEKLLGHYKGALFIGDIADAMWDTLS